MATTVTFLGSGGNAQSLDLPPGINLNAYFSGGSNFGQPIPLSALGEQTTNFYGTPAGQTFLGTPAGGTFKSSFQEFLQDPFETVTPMSPMSSPQPANPQTLTDLTNPPSGREGSVTIPGLRTPILPALAVTGATGAVPRILNAALGTIFGLPGGESTRRLGFPPIPSPPIPSPTPPSATLSGFELGAIEPNIGGPSPASPSSSLSNFLSPTSIAATAGPALLSGLFPKSPAAQAAALVAGPALAGLTGGAASALGAGFLGIPSAARLIFDLTRKPILPGDPDPFYGYKPAFEALGLELPTIPPPPPRPAWSPPPAPNLAEGTGKNIELLRELVGFKYPPFSTVYGSPPLPGLSPLAQKVISKTAELAMLREQADAAAFARIPVEGG